NTPRCFETTGCGSPNVTTSIPTARAPRCASNSTICRRRGSAMALNTSAVVRARGMPRLYSHNGIVQARTPEGRFTMGLTGTRVAKLVGEVLGTLAYHHRSTSDGYPRDAMQLNQASWNIVRQPGGAKSALTRALALAEEACRVTPDDINCLNTRGVAQYR